MSADVIDIRDRRDGRRALPHNLAAEASILGGIILDNERLRDVSELETDDFYDARHRVVWQAIRNLELAARPIDVVTLESEIEKQGKLDAISGIAFLGELVLNVPTSDNVIAYRDTVRLHSRNRRAILEISSCLERSYTWPHDPSELVGELSARLMRIDGLGAPPAKRIKLISIGESLEDLDRIARAPVYPTPFETLNDAIGFGGFLGTQVYTVAAGTGRGKTTWVAAIGAHAAQSVPVIVATYEMKPGYFIARKAAGVLGCHSNEILRGNIAMSRVLEAMPYARMFLMHKPSLADLRVATEYITQKYSTPPLVVVDYIQKLADEIALRQQRPDLRMATSEASATLLDIADRAGAAVIAVSAIGRGKGKVMAAPRKSQPYELVEVSKESGAVEYDGAGLIVLTLSDEFEGDERVGTMTLAKARFGEEMHIDARYNGRRGTWRDCGRVEVDARTAIMKSPAGPREDLKAKITAILLAGGPASSKSALYSRVKGNKSAFNTTFDAMIEGGSIAMNPNLPGDGIVAAGSTFDIDPQGALGTT